MVEKLGAEGFMNELFKGFELLMDPQKHLITFHSLKKNAALLGLKVDDDDDDDDDDELLHSMLKEGDLDGDGCLDHMEFCVLMFRLSPNLMNQATNIMSQDFQ
ncbi:hypothetical protein SASPL_123963 [Salvia splendens]|uniref:EF-hand domain-containing protein n=2 Tax=Salvia splendens TaxID=180675 RepID=A0A8X8ZTY1_SALSN|nr:hypothetical protein SASPL_123963 [Salvia splendens]